MSEDKPRKLRGPALAAAAIQELKIWPADKPLTWQALADIFGVTRPAVSEKLDVRREFARRKLTTAEVKKASRRRDSGMESVEKERAYLRAENDRLRETIARMQLRFASVEENALSKGIRAEELWAPIERINR